jgi:hypothetical protein
VAGAFLFTFVVALSFNAIPFGRYALPVTVCGYFVTSQLISSTVHDLQRRTRWGWAAMVACAAAVFLLQGQRCLNFVEQFRDDSRQRLHEWVAKNLPSSAMIAADSYTSLGFDGDPVRFPKQPSKPHRVQQIFFAPQLGSSAEQLAASGYTHVAVSRANYHRYFEPGVEGLPGYEHQFREFRNCYAELFARGYLEWASVPKPSTNAYVNNEIRLYRISHLRRR